MNPWDNLSSLSQGEIRSLQNKKLHTFVNKYLYPFSTYYRDLFDQNNINPKSIRTIEDLKHLPLTSKLDFGDGKYLDFIVKPDKAKIRKYWPKGDLLKLAAKKILRGEDVVSHDMNNEFRPVFMTFTTGTTSTPVPFLYTNYDLNNLRISGNRMLELFNIGPDEKIVNIFPFAPHLAFWQVFFGGVASCVLTLSTGGGKVMGTDGNIAAIEKIKPSTILGVPSYIYHLLREAHERKCKMPYIKNIVLGASRITFTFKHKIAQLLKAMGSDGVSVFGTYGFTEARCAWAECPTSLDTSSGYFLYPDKEIFEVVNPDTGEVLGEGESGEIVYTSLDSRASSVFRFRTGDYVNGGITYAKCPYTKMYVPRMSSDITRMSNVKDLQLSKIKGSLVNLNHFEGILNQFADIDEWQVEIGKKNDDPFDIDELIIHLTVGPNCNQSRLVEDVQKKVMKDTEVRPNDIRFIPMEEMVKRLELETANKERRILDKRPKD